MMNANTNYTKQQCNRPQNSLLLVTVRALWNGLGQF